MIGEKFSDMRIRFMSPHPKDFPLDTLKTINKYSNIARCLHIPMQSGSNEVLKRMRR